MNISSKLSQNRAEELPLDIWKDFVVPRFFNEIDLLGSTKPRIVVGGRGCGKTMLLRYVSFQTQFSPNRRDIPDNTYKNIGLYWRIDTQFAKIMNGRSLDPDEWIIAFEHFISIYIAVQIVSSLLVIAKTGNANHITEELKILRFDELSCYDSEFTGNSKEFLTILERRLKGFEMWVSNLKKVPEPVFLANSFVLELIKVIESQCPNLNGVKYHVLLDEFENLLEYQQRCINTRIKHSEQPLIFSIAMKRNGFVTRQTLNTESISDPADFRTIDLEEKIMGADYPLFAAELLLLNLCKSGIKNTPVQEEQLRRDADFGERLSGQYRQEVMDYVGRIFPGVSEYEMASEVFTSPALLGILRKKIERALKLRFGNTDGIDALLDPDFPRESVVCSALLYRKGTSKESILEEFARLKNGEDSKFKNWVSNNFVGCLLQLYEPYDKTSPLYAGFHTFVTLSRGNARHFLELCYNSFGMLVGGEMKPDAGVPTVSIDGQAKAAKHASTTFLREIRSFGAFGNRLHSFVMRLGSLFALSHSRHGQSEPEINHFSIKGDLGLTDEDRHFINESIKWTILFEEVETKQKDSMQAISADFEYVLNPIYAPYFNISYRKRRRLVLTQAEFELLSGGGYESFTGLLKGFSKRWAIDLEDSSPSLFSQWVD